MIFASPQALVAYFWMMMFYVPGLNIIRVKNKMKKKAMVTAADIHMNARLDFPVFDKMVSHVVEVQLVLENFVLARDLEHKYYEIKRCERLKEILAPIFQ